MMREEGVTGTSSKPSLLSGRKKWLLKCKNMKRVKMVHLQQNAHAGEAAIPTVTNLRTQPLCRDNFSGRVVSLTLHHIYKARCLGPTLHRSQVSSFMDFA